jgi:hypothetical protein
MQGLSSSRYTPPELETARIVMPPYPALRREVSDAQRSYRFVLNIYQVAMAKPGLGFEIVVDEQTQRKFPSIVTFDEKGERLYGNSASSLVR